MFAFFTKLSRAMAYIGGIVLVALIILTCLSVTGRALNGMLHSDLFQTYLPGFAHWAISIGIGPINGDFELVEAGIAFSIFAFMPLCQISGSHAAVDIFVSNIRGRASRILRLATDILFAVVMTMIAVQLYHGMMSKLHTGQTTLLIEFPVWWAYAPSLVGASITAIVALYVVLNRFYETWTNQNVLPADLEADH